MASGRADRIKLAIKSQPALPPKEPLLLDFEQAVSLEEIMKDVCGRWGVDNPEKYAFMYVEHPHGQAGKFGYITPENRAELADGDILRVALAPNLQAKEFYTILTGNDKEQHRIALEQLQSFSKDTTFASEFIRLKGVPLLLMMFDKAPSQNESDVLILTSMIGSFEELMEHGLVQWEGLVTDSLVSKLIRLAVNTRMQDLVRAPLLARCFSILQLIIFSSETFAQFILRNITFEQIVPFLQCRSEAVQQTCLSLTNGMLMVSSNKGNLFQLLKDLKYGRTIMSEIIDRKGVSLSRELSHQLYTYQQLLLNQYEDKMREPFLRGNNTHEQGLLFLQQAIPEEFSSGRPMSSAANDQHQVWKLLGFIGQNPYTSLAEVPPGILALNFMVYFAKHKRDTFVRLLLTKDNPCPFAQSSIKLTALLTQIFKVGEPPSELAMGCLMPLVVSENPFEELYCVTIQLFYKTWREMRAGDQDFDKVMTVVHKQISTVIQQGHNFSSFENLRQKFFEYSYKKIVSASVEKNQLLDDSILKAKPVVQLREAITPQIRELVKQQRLRHLVTGSLFPKVEKKARGYFYCRLSPNWKVIHYGDAKEDSKPPPIESLKNKIPVSDMRLMMGKDCPHVKTHKGRTELAFSIFFNGEDHLDFLPQEESLFSIWVDGLSILCNQDMPSKLAEDDLNTLLLMEMKLRLLDLENVEIPNDPPSIPPDPPNYDFYYKLD